MPRYHINPDGNTGPCSASKVNCPFGGDDEHFDTSQDARKAYEKVMAAGGEWLPVKKPSEPTTRLLTPSEINVGDKVYMKANSGNQVDHLVLIEVDQVRPDGFAGQEVGTTKRFGSPLTGSKKARAALTYPVLVEDPEPETEASPPVAQVESDAITAAVMEKEYETLDAKYSQMKEVLTLEGDSSPYAMGQLAELLRERNQVARRVGKPLYFGDTPEAAEEKQREKLKALLIDEQQSLASEEDSLMGVKPGQITAREYNQLASGVQQHLRQAARLNMLIHEATPESMKYNYELNWRQARLHKQAATYSLAEHEQSKPGRFQGRREWNEKLAQLQERVAASEAEVERSLAQWRGQNND